MLPNKRVISLSVVLLTGYLAIPISGASAANTSVKVGNCYNYKWSDVSAPFAVKGTVSCTSTHTAETYRVGTWPTDTAPDSMDGKASWSIANSICQPWIGTSKSFNYWAWYSPNPDQWAAGDRWVRCDAMKTTNSQSPYTYATFKKKMLDIK